MKGVKCKRVRKGKKEQRKEWKRGKNKEWDNKEGKQVKKQHEEKVRDIKQRKKVRYVLLIMKRIWKKLIHIFKDIIKHNLDANKCM